MFNKMESRTAAKEDSVLKNYTVLCEVLLGQIHDSASAAFLARMEKFSAYLGLKLSHIIFSSY